MIDPNAPVYTFNNGLVSKQALGRIDLQRNRFAAEQMDNWMPRAVGSMMLRPGWQYVGATRANSKTYPIPFVRDLSATAIIEFSDTVFRVRRNDAWVTRVGVATLIDQPTFGAVGGWSLGGTSGATETISGGTLTLAPTAIGASCYAEQSVTVAAGDQTTEHGVRVAITQGPFIFTIGSSSGAFDIAGPYTLNSGTHSLAFTPGAGVGTVYIRLMATIPRTVTATQCQIESAGPLELSSNIAAADLSLIRYAQSADVTYIACAGYQPQKILRHTDTSWSIEAYFPEDGPFLTENSTDINMQSSVLSGTGVLTASRNFFTSKHAGALFRVFTDGQTRSDAVAGSGAFSNTIRVSGVGAARVFSYSTSGTWSGTITLQRSFTNETSGFEDVTSSGTNFGSTQLNDTFDNSIVWYRIGFKAGNYVSGTVTVSLTYGGGGGAGIARVTSVIQPTQVNIETFVPFTSGNSSTDWNEGMWSSQQGWPSSVALYQGRLWWFGLDKIVGSVSDAYESFSYDAVGDSATINRTIGYGPVAVTQWALPLQRLILGLQMSEASIRSTAFDEPITPTNFSVKDCSTQGSAPVQGMRVDNRGFFVQRSNRRLYELLYNSDDLDYTTVDMTALLPDLDSDFTQIVVQRQPDTRIYCVRADGTVLVLLIEPAEKVVCWYSISTPNGLIERMVVLPGTEEDRVYYYVNRNGTRTIEKSSLVSECQGSTLNKQADCFITYSGGATTTLAGLPDAVVGQNVVVWGDGKYIGSFHATSSTLTIPVAVSNAVVGLSYQALFKSAKLAFVSRKGTALNQKKRICHLGLAMYNTHSQGIEFGQDFVTMDNLPLRYQGAPTDTNSVYQEYDEPMITVPGKWNTDSRLCLRATAPKPVTMLGCSISIPENEY